MDDDRPCYADGISDAVSRVARVPWLYTCNVAVLNGRTGRPFAFCLWAFAHCALILGASEHHAV